VVGGVHAEVQPQDFQHPSIDFVISRSPLASFRALVENLLAGNGAESLPPQDQPRSVELPQWQPDRSIIDKYRSRYYYVFHRPCALIKTSYGCPYSCSFCFCIQITGEQYQTRPLEEVVDEIQTIPEPEIYIVDDNFLVDRKRVLEFCDLLESRGIQKRFLIYGRADFIAENEDVIQHFRDCGLRAVIVGLESFEQTELDTWSKRNEIEKSERAVEILHRHDIDCYGTFILSPDWSGEDFKKLGAWIKKLGIYFVNLQPLTPLPGTPIFDEYADQLIVQPEEHELWDLAHLVLQPTRMSQSAFYWNIIKLYVQTLMSGFAVKSMFRRYGVWPTLRLSRGVYLVLLQYLAKVVSSFFSGSKPPLGRSGHVG